MLDMVKAVDITEKDSKKATLVFPEDKLDDKGNFIARREGEVAPKETVSNVDSTRGPRVLAIVDDSKKSKLMLAELKERKVNVVTTAKADLQSKDIVKAVKDVIKSESDKNNQYEVVFLPITNTDFNKNVADFSKIRAESGLPVNLYFQDREDVDIANKAFVRKIE